MIKKRIRYIQRYQDILTALFHYGFGHLVRDLGLLDFVRTPKRKKDPNYYRSTAERLRLLLEELGPTFIKMGQVASTRSDIFPDYLIKELSKLQDHVPPFPFKDVKAIIEEDLGNSLDSIFQHFDEEPIAAASIGQVHKAILPSGEKVVVKVRRPNIEQQVLTDLAIMEDLIGLAEERLVWAKRFNLLEVFHEFAEALKLEMNYKEEAQNTERIYKQTEDEEDVEIPTIYPSFSTKRMMTIAYVEGIKITSIREEDGYDLSKVAETFAKSLFQQIFVHGFFHGDPHPGNIFVKKDHTIALIDFGMVGRLTPEMRQNMALLVIGLKSRHTDKVLKALKNTNIVQDHVNQQLLRDDLDALRLRYYDMPISDISLGEAVQDLFAVANKHHCKVPSDLTILGKSLLSVERIVSTLDPNLRIMDLIEPFGRTLIKERYDPRRLSSLLKDEIVDSVELLRDLPRELRSLSKTVQHGKVKVEISVPEVDRLINKIDKVSNKVSFAIVLMSFSIIMVGIIVGASLTSEPTILLQLPAIEVGFVIATLMFIWIIYSIIRSGRF
ncbi:ABC1 kinase family protein [Alkalicoccobacillus porphyridii]|uniref:AarF/ABC1/UbiB kinase family protein n=1 Tax=Alkalicoccobacillus porphyridii TaxID=2597270 RepID=A0A553ZZJ2_9BACI|nr:AarF/ABC1/UbiB kinase family protein [Alkalicoccobacillus porphyridii]TSB46852.1 AarF/ABC1/UbiB kinase family protein [Alkalicoccobacillus porphyridii]